MTFDEAVEALEALASEGVVVAASVWGAGDGAFSLMDTRGVLRLMESDDSIREWLERRELLGEESVAPDILTIPLRPTTATDGASRCSDCAGRRS